MNTDTNPANNSSSNSSTPGSDGTEDDTFDVVVIGAGPVGENVADRITRAGLSAAVVERELVGGECSYWACMPTKALLRSAAVLRAARNVPGAAQAVSGELDAAAVLQRRDAFASHWHDEGQVSWLHGAGIALYRGQGRITAPRVVQVDDGTGRPIVLTARHAVVLATGTSALVPDITGLRAAGPWTSRDGVAATTVPDRLAILGGGVVAAEMATAYAALGSAVTVLARDGVLPRTEPFAAAHVTAALREAGAEVRLGVEVTAVHREGTGQVRLELGDGTQLSADEVLVAVGRTPNTADLGLETIGLEPGSWLTVDDTLRVLDEGGRPLAGDWLYAAGDVNHRVLLTHQGKYQARALGDVITARARGERLDHGPWGRHAVTADEKAVPQVVFTDPEVASVGLTAAAAQAAGLSVRIVDHDLGAVAGAAVHTDGYRGHARMVVDEDREVIVGFTLVGPDVAELLHAATIAIVAEVPVDRLRHAVPAFPTISEVWLRLLETYERPA
ncbi:dihydrolipoyl dehydrogenase family protein [Kineococcus sp. SYSU DK003]|uniref:dihydrolipoyl dehydrogenase family protein n=1 Tax=Kineococcus sp. SYSU DK003 TaxID=3383124 RepID=UPI003D7DD977